MTRRALPVIAGMILTAVACGALSQAYRNVVLSWAHKHFQLESKLMTTISLNAEIDAFVSAQNKNRGQALPGGGVLPLDYNALSGTVPPGGNAVTGISGIAAGAAPITLPSGQTGNAVIIDGVVSTIASTGGAHTYSFSVDTTGLVTLTDNNTGNSETIRGATYLVFDGGVTNSSGGFQSIFMIEGGNGALTAAAYNAAFERIPEPAGIEFYIDQFGTPALPDMHTEAEYFIGSNEFKADYPTVQAADRGGPNDQVFVTGLYSGILHRTATQTEVQFYLNALAGTLVDSNGHSLAAVDRATVFEYFISSPENQVDIAGWLINPGKGAVSFGAMTQQAAQAVLSSEAAAGTINAADFANMSPTGQATAIVNGGSVGIVGTNFYGAQGTSPGFAVDAPNVTLNLSATYYLGEIMAPNITVNGVSTGGSVVAIETIPSGVDGAGNSYPAVLGSGTVNLFGSDNWIEIVGHAPVASVTIANGWNATDVFSGNFGSIPSTASPFASLVARYNGIVYAAAGGVPMSGSTIGSQNGGTWFTTHQLAINVGAVTDDSISTMVAVANQVYRPGDIGTVDQPNSETAFFFGQDPQGNTMVVYWHGDSSHSNRILASDITGAVELVGVQASSLHDINFRH